MKQISLSQRVLPRWVLASTFAVASILAAGCSSAKSKSYVDSQEKSMGGTTETEVQKCFELAKKQGQPGEPAAQGEIEVSVTVSPGGKVTDARAIRSTMNSKRLEDCVCEVVRRAPFDKPAGGRMNQFTRVYKFGA
jgi:TonB family protein